MTATAVTAAQAPTGDAAFIAIELADLIESPKNPRTHYDETALQALADNLTTVGQITPIIVRPHPTQRGKYEIAAGHRRFRAAQRSGREYLDAVVRQLDDVAMAEILNLENLQRDDLNPIEEALGFRTLMEDAGYTIARLAERVDLSERAVYDKLALLRLIPEAQDLIARRVLSPAHGALLARLTTDDQRRALETDDATMTREEVSGTHFPDEVVPLEGGMKGEFELNDKRKPRTVRELKQWIDNHVRFEADQVAQADLAMDLPATAQLLEDASRDGSKVLHITRSYRVHDDAKDPKQRTYGSAAWKRADGEVEPYSEWGTPDPTAKPSLSCEHARPALVVAGPGRGQAFQVCVARDKCLTHWAKEIRQKAKEAKAKAARPAPSTGANYANDSETWERERQRNAARAAWQTQAHEDALREALAGLDVSSHLDVVVAGLLGDCPDADALERLGNLFGEIQLQRTFALNLAAVRTLTVRQQWQLLVTLSLAGGIEVPSWSKPDPDFAAALGALGVDVTAYLKEAEAAAKAKEQAEKKAEKKAAAPRVEKKPVKIAAKRRAGDVAAERKAKRAQPQHDDGED